jgi:hypothetical protein
MSTRIEIKSAGGGGASISTATLMRTGLTTIFRTGDDADRSSEGRATDFFTLAENNPFGNLDRFTDELGTQTYADDIVIDWSTYNGSTVLGYRRTRNGVNVTWTNAIDGALLVSIGTFTTGWRLPNFNELNNIVNWNTLALAYSPFNVNLNPSITIWCSTTTTSAYRLNFTNLFTAANKTSASAHYIPCRTFTVTGTILT